MGGLSDTLTRIAYLAAGVLFATIISLLGIVALKWSMGLWL